MAEPVPVPASVLDYVIQLHGVVDAQTAPLARTHGTRLRCHLGCTACCVDGITVFEIEAARIRAGAPEVLRQEPGPIGACAFLKEDGACRVYAHRPYVCRTQGLPLRWAERPGVELRDICTLNAEGPPIDALPPDQSWTLGPVEARLRQAQDRVQPGARVALRDLFEGGGR